DGEEDVHRVSVDGVERNAARTDEECGELPPEVLESPVGNGDAVADARRLERLALGEDAVEIGRSRRRSARREQLGEGVERGVLRFDARSARGHLHSFCRKNLSQNHGTFAPDATPPNWKSFVLPRCDSHSSGSAFPFTDAAAANCPALCAPRFLATCCPLP